jgi:hypothetical protein
MISFNEWQQAISAKLKWIRDHNGSILHPDWITEAVMKDHADISGEDADFHLFGSRGYIRSEVTAQINKIGKVKDDRQGTLEGFEFLQEFYVVERDKVLVAVSVFDMTDVEIDRKAEEKDSLAMANAKHATELRRFKELRRLGVVGFISRATRKGDDQPAA